MNSITKRTPIQRQHYTEDTHRTVTGAASPAVVGDALVKFVSLSYAVLLRERRLFRVRGGDAALAEILFPGLHHVRQVMSTIIEQTPNVTVTDAPRAHTFSERKR